MIRDMCFAVLGYLCGSVLFAQIAARLTGAGDVCECSRDGNPGTANAFVHGGFLCGCLTLVGDLSKGFLPIALYQFCGGNFSTFALFKPLVLAAPVLGHAFPVLFHFKGGKGIATSFGCLLGLLPMAEPFWALAVSYIFFSVVLLIDPHTLRTAVSYSTALILMLVRRQHAAVVLGFAAITWLVLLRHKLNAEPSSERRIKLLWMH